MVVETIDFFDDEDAELPPPMTQRDVVLLNRAGAFEEEEAAKTAGGEAGKGQEDTEVSHAFICEHFYCMEKLLFLLAVVRPMTHQ